MENKQNSKSTVNYDAIALNTYAYYSDYDKLLTLIQDQIIKYINAYSIGQQPTDPDPIGCEAQYLDNIYLDLDVKSRYSNMNYAETIKDPIKNIVKLLAYNRLACKADSDNVIKNYVYFSNSKILVFLELLSKFKDTSDLNNFLDNSNQVDDYLEYLEEKLTSATLYLNGDLDISDDENNVNCLNCDKLKDLYGTSIDKKHIALALEIYKFTGIQYRFDMNV